MNSAVNQAGDFFWASDAMEPRAATLAGTAPTDLVLILDGKHTFVKTQLDAGKLPPPQALASHLKQLVTEIGPVIKVSPQSVGEWLANKLSGLGWDVRTNAPVPGSSPPRAEAVQEFYAEALSALLPDLAAAKAAADQAKKALDVEESELNRLEEEALDGELSGRQQKELAASQAKVPKAKVAAAAAAKLLQIVEARLAPEALALAKKTEELNKQAEAMRVAQLTKDAAQAAKGSGKGGGKGGGGGGGGGGGRGGGGGGGGGGGKGGGGGRGGGGSTDDPHDREARAAELATRHAAKAADAAKAAADAIAALRGSDFTLVEASQLRNGGYVVLSVGTSEEPCRIQALSTSKTGKHGHAKVSITAHDVASGRKIERNLRADERVTVPGKRWLAAIGAGGPPGGGGSGPGPVDVTDG